jgi:hypothetical protein
MTKAVDNQKGSAARKTKFTTSVVDPEPELIGQVGSGSGIIVSDADLAFLKRKFV